MKIIWVSNSPWTGTGYGVQTNLFVWRLQALGHEVTVSCFYGLQGAPQKLDGMLMLPAGRDAYGNDVLLADAEHVQADIVISLMDVWVLNPDLMKKTRWCPWTPLDHDPAPPHVAKTLEAAFQPIAYSQFGVAKLREAGIEALFVPHGVDAQVFRPIERADARRRLSCPEDVFLAGIVAANKGVPSRKAFDQQIRAFAQFHARHPDSMLYLHTDMLGLNGENIRRIVELSGLPPGAIATVPPYKYARGMIGADWMAHAYSAMDVLLNATKGEGFGVPIIEALACGTPVIVTDFSAMPELCLAGWKVGYSDKFYSQESYQVTPDVGEIAAALGEAYRTRGDADLRQQARQGALAYDADHVTHAYWKPALETIERKLKQARHSSKRRPAKRRRERSEQRRVRAEC